MSIHHVTAIAGDPQRNLDFYAGTLGLRLVKLTVNFDDPGSYHLYFGDETGRPGSILTFFPWPDGQRGRQGTGQVGTVSLAFRPASLGWWIERLLQHGVKYDGPTRRFDEQVLAFSDPDGLLLELVGDAARRARRSPGRDGPVPAEHAVRGIHGATIWEDGDRGTAEFLTAYMGFAPGRRGGRPAPVRVGRRGRGHGRGPAPRAGILVRRRRRGTVHHVAFRGRRPTRRSSSGARGSSRRACGITPVVDRQYFHSVYFREPGGVLFEIATDRRASRSTRRPPSWARTSSCRRGTSRCAARIEQTLPPLRLPRRPAASASEEAP